MFRTYILLCLFLELRAKTAIVANMPTLAETLHKLNDRLDQLTISPPKVNNIPESIAEKLDRFNALSVDAEDLLDEDEEVLSAVQMWGLVDPDQLDAFAKDLEQLKVEGQPGAAAADYNDDMWNDEDLQDVLVGDYIMDGGDDWDDDDDTNTVRPETGTPSALLRKKPSRLTVSAVEHVSATNMRPRILDESKLTRLERFQLRTAAMEHMHSVAKNSKCLTPQPRWFTVRELAPAAGTLYFPPCVMLHRCAPDSGCCHNEDDVCAPVEGNFVSLPFYLNKANGSTKYARMEFYNHTACACVSNDTLTGVDLATWHRQNDENLDSVTEKDNDQNGGVKVREVQVEWQRTTDEPKLDEETAPPQLKRCTCPALFRAKLTNAQCSCVCEWSNSTKQNACLSLARGQEHFGLRDRVCVSNGDCHPPTCRHGAYNPKTGHCPQHLRRRYRYRKLNAF